LVFCLALLAGGTPANAETRIALVIGNSEYTGPSTPRLRNPINDARIIAEALRKTGFDSVVLKENATKVGMRAAVRDFSQRAASADVSVVYYAGHGVEVSGVNYLIPIDAQIGHGTDLPFETISLNDLENTVRPRRLSLVIIDACRENPFEIQMATGQTRSVSRGLAPPPETSGDTLVVYSARSGTVATDGAGANSPFALAMARRIQSPGLEIGLLLRQVRDDVLASTQNTQQPFTYGSLGGEAFYFLPPATNEAAAEPVDAKSEAPRPSLEVELWQNALADNVAGAYQGYLSTFPAGPHAEEARSRLHALQLSLATNAPRTSGSAPATADGSALSARSTRILAALRPYNRSRIHVYPDIPAPILEKAQAWIGKRCGSQILAVFDQSILANGSGDETVFCDNEIFARNKGIVEVQYRYGYVELSRFRPQLQGEFQVRYGQMVLNANFFPNLGSESRLFALLVNEVLAAAAGNSRH
jgi:hypothetical protein